MTEQAFRNRRPRHIIYGQTYHAEATLLDAGYSDGKH